LLEAGGTREMLQPDSKGISSDMSLLVLDPGLLAPLKICFAESNYCRRGLEASKETWLHLGKRVQVPDLGPLGLQRLSISWDGVWLTLRIVEIVPATLL